MEIHERRTTVAWAEEAKVILDEAYPKATSDFGLLLARIVSSPFRWCIDNYGLYHNT